MKAYKSKLAIEYPGVGYAAYLTAPEDYKLPEEAAEYWFDCTVEEVRYQLEKGVIRADYNNPDGTTSFSVIERAEK